jgi:hypothetical protein
MRVGQKANTPGLDMQELLDDRREGGEKANMPSGTFEAPWGNGSNGPFAIRAVRHIGRPSRTGGQTASITRREAANGTRREWTRLLHELHKKPISATHFLRTICVMPARRDW